MHRMVNLDTLPGVLIRKHSALNPRFAFHSILAQVLEKSYTASQGVELEFPQIRQPAGRTDDVL
jgi:hypothetical protein